MKPTRYFLIQSLIAFTLFTIACSPSSPASNNQTNTNTNPAQSKPANGNAAPKAPQANTGVIEVTSVPPGAGVTLIPTSEDGAGVPRSYGLTPATITDLAPGKYTVNIQKVGFGYAQKEVQVAANKTVKVSLPLRKQAAGGRR
ncbi:MAG: PEGA domain-containing protein [Blastocatellia bacterium]